MLRGGQIPRSGRYLLDASGRLHRWPRSRVDAVAIVTVRARRIRFEPTAVEICGVPDPAFDLDKVFHELVAFEVPAPLAPVEVADLRIAELGEALVAVVDDRAPPAPRPRHTPLPKISLKDVPSGMEQLAERWRGAP